MVIIEMREAAYDKAFGLLDEIKDLGKKKKMAICELEEAIWECYEASKDKETESETDEENTDMEYRMRGGMRRRSMRDHMYHDDYEDDDDMRMRGYRRSRGMRGYRSGRYSY